MIKFICKMATLLSSTFLLSACNGIVNISSSDEALGYEPIYSTFPLPYVFIASSVQWNEDYAVSAAHTPFLKNVVYKCSTGCDLVFIKRKATGKIPEWRYAAFNEKIKAYGTTPLYMTASSEGSLLKTRFIQNVSNNNKSGREFYRLADMALLKGMSGGPVYGSDGKVIGISLGFVNKSMMTEQELNNAPDIKNTAHPSYFLQTEIVEREWKKFQYQENQKLKKS